MRNQKKERETRMKMKSQIQNPNQNYFSFDPKKGVINKNPSNTVSGFRESCGHLTADVGFSKVRYQIFKIGRPRSLCIPACVSLNHPQNFSISTISSPHSFCFSFSISVPFSHHHHPLPDSISYVSLVRLSLSCDLFLFYEFDSVSED